MCMCLKYHSCLSVLSNHFIFSDVYKRQGYLRATNVISEFNDNPICSLKLPNGEIKSVFQKEILDNYNTLFNGSLLRDFELALRTGDTTLFTDTLQKYLLQSASTFDTTNENFYHGKMCIRDSYTPYASYYYNIL